MDWLLFIYKDKQVDKFMDLAKISSEVYEFRTRQMIQRKTREYDELEKKGIKTDVFEGDFSYVFKMPRLKNFFIFLKIQDLSDIKLNCDEKQISLRSDEKDYEAYLKRPTPGQNIIKMGLMIVLLNLLNVIKLFLSLPTFQLLFLAYNDKLAPSIGAVKKFLISLEY